jgi:tetratricopeptide (TPR) repeat protein
MRRALLFLVVAAVVVAVFWPSLGADWVTWDDDTNFLLNPNFRGLGAEQLRWMWTSFHLGIWIPLSWMTLGANYLLFGMEPAGYHATNVLLHAVNAVFLTQLGIDVLARPAGSARARIAATSPTALMMSAALGALLFALHPLRVESVTWITERRDVLSGMFYLGTLLAFVRFADGGPRARRWYALTFASFVAALLAKGTAVTQPGAMALLWWMPLGHIGGAAGWSRAVWQRALRVLAPFGLVSVIFAVVVLRGLAYPQLPVAGKLAVSLYSWCFYLAKTIWPSGLSPLYIMPEPLDPLATRFVMAGVIVIVSVIAGWRLYRRVPSVVVAVLAFTVIVFPLLGLHQGGPQIAADRNTYNASIPLALLAGGAVLTLWERMRAAAVVALAAVAALAVVTWQQQAYWQNSEALWLRVLAVEPDNAHGHNNYGNVLMAAGRSDEAIARYTRAVELQPSFGPALANLGVALNATGRPAEAIQMLTRALVADSTRDDVEANLGGALMQTGDLDGAVRHLERAVRLNAQNANAEVNWGNALVRRGDAAGAAAHYARAVVIQPANADAHLNWGVALAQQGKLVDAREHFQRAVDLAPGSDAARQYLAQVERDLAARR